MAQTVSTNEPVVPASVEPDSVTPVANESVGQLTTRQDVAIAFGLGNQALAPGLVAVHVYVSDDTTLLLPPIAYPLAHVVVTLLNVVPVSEPPEITDAAGKVKGAQSTTRQVFAATVGSGSHALAAGPEGVHVYVTVVVVLLPPPTE